MKASSFWPPGRTRDRLAAEVYRRRHLDEPWLTRAAISLLRDLLKPSDVVLEWGAGSSTAWLGARAARVVAVEHDPVWFERVRSQLTLRSLPADSVRLLSPNGSPEPSRTAYVRAIDDLDGAPSVCLIDGEHRAACALEAVSRLSSGGVLVIDDVHMYLDHPTETPHSRAGMGPLDAAWADFQNQVTGWRLIWTSDGYSDTAFWIKP